MSTKQFDDYFDPNKLNAMITELLDNENGDVEESVGALPQALTTLYMMHKYSPDFMIYPELIKDICIVDKRKMSRLPFDKLIKDMSSPEFLTIANNIDVIMEVKSFMLNKAKTKTKIAKVIFNKMCKIEKEYNEWTNRIAEYKTGVKGSGGFHRKIILLLFVYKENNEKVEFSEITNLQNNLNEYLYPSEESIPVRDKNRLFHNIVFLNGYELHKRYIDRIEEFRSYLQQMLAAQCYFEPQMMFDEFIKDDTFEPPFSYHIADDNLFVSRLKIPSSPPLDNEPIDITMTIDSISFNQVYFRQELANGESYEIPMIVNKDKYGRLSTTTQCNVE